MASKAGMDIINISLGGSMSSWEEVQFKRGVHNITHIILF